MRRETYDLEKERRVALRENGRAGRAGILSLFMIELVAVVAGVSCLRPFWGCQSEWNVPFRSIWNISVGSRYYLLS